jgi:hypothetical protein
MYRHWASAADLLYDAMQQVESPLFRPGAGPIGSWLRTELRRIAIDLGQPNTLQFTAALLSRVQFDPEAVALRDRLLARSTTPLAAALERAVADGELVGAPIATELLAVLLGPLQFRVVFEGLPATDEFIDAVIDGGLAPFRSS